MIDEISNVAKMDIFETISFGKFSPEIAMLYIINAPESPTRFNNFANSGYSSKYLIVNMGTLFIALYTLFCLTFLVTFCRPLEMRSRRFHAKV